jgi:hypothetical protein
MGVSQFFNLGPMWTGRVSRQGHGCNVVSGQSTPDGPEEFYELGAPLPGATIADASWQAAGSMRFVIRGLMGPRGDEVPIDNDIAPPNGWIVPRYFDYIINADCDPQWTPEGVVRCVPASVVIADPAAPMFPDTFSDSACQMPALTCPIMGTAQACGGLPVISMAVDTNGEKRAASLNVAEDVATLYAMSAGGGCQSVPADSFAPFFFYKPGASLPWDTYPELTEINGRASGAP